MNDSDTEDQEGKNEWDLLLSETHAPLSRIPERIKLSGVWVDLDNPSPYAQHLYQALYSALCNDWYQVTISEISQSRLQGPLKDFLLWLRSYRFTRKHADQILNKYQTYRINKCGVLPQSTGLKIIFLFLTNATYCEQVSMETIAYVHQLKHTTRIEDACTAVPYSLTGYCATMPWLREALGERKYMQLESPRLLMRSFSVVVAATLEWILAHKAIAKSRIGSNLPDVQQQRLRGTNDNGVYGRKLMRHVANFANSQPDPTTELLLADLANPPVKQLVVERFIRGDFSIRPNIKGKETNLFQRPHIFTPGNWDKPGGIEELLFGWLMAWLAVQPNDISKLKPQNIVLIKNPAGRITELFVDYYKGRAKRNYRTMTLSTKEVEGSAILSYLKSLPEDIVGCFSSKNSIRFKLSFGKNSLPLTLVTLWQEPKLAQHLREQLALRRAGTLFWDLMVVLQQKGGQTFNSWMMNHNSKDGAPVQKYIASVPYALNPSPLSYGLIKTSAVQSRSDRYRVEDLVNINSHKSNTERISYLTDENKEWVNQNGRISRIVLHDMENFVYRPSLNQAVVDSRERILRTRIIATFEDSTTDAATAHIDKLGRASNINNMFTEDASDILVMDTAETVVYMLHYIDEATKNYRKLVQHALIFFERTVLPNAEWMSVILQNHLSPHVVIAGTQYYNKIQPHLPSLFDNELQGGVST